MIIQFYLIIICLLLSIFAILSVAQNISSSKCVQSCGTRHLPYPFGFSDGCGIKLNCSSDNRSRIGDFLVQNVTNYQILLTIPENCNRSIAGFSTVFSENFAPTSHNGLMFADCKSPLNDCLILNTLERPDFEFGACKGGGNGGPYNISCYSEDLDDEKEFLNYKKVISAGNCSYLFSSIMVDLNESRSSVIESSSVWLEFGMMELGWWINGECYCDPNATCKKIPYGGRMGFRCNCKEGYAGDGFANGIGCKKDYQASVSHCSAPKYMPVRCGETRVGILVAGIIAGASMVIILYAVCICIKRRYTSVKRRCCALHLLSEAAGNSNVPFYPYKEIERATNRFAEKQRLGTGAYGTVYAGKLHNDEWVAIKKIRHQDHDSVEQVMNEIKLLSSVSHPNLVRLQGCCIENGEQILVYEYMPNGTLSQHLQRKRGAILPWTVRLTVATETAHAIAHLHTAMNPPIYHRDVKSSNILLDYNFKSKVADFGLSRFGMVDDSHVSTAPQGTPGYVDPQYHQNFHLSDKSDVYSFGVVLFEIITAKKVVDFSRPHNEINLAALAIDRIGKGCIDDIIDPFLEPNRDAWTLSSVHKMVELAFRCLAFHRDMRPSMMEVANELDQIRLTAWAPMEEDIYMGSSLPSSLNNAFTPNKVVVENATDTSPVSVQDPWSSQDTSS